MLISYNNRYVAPMSKIFLILSIYSKYDFIHTYLLFRSLEILKLFKYEIFQSKINQYIYKI